MLTINALKTPCIDLGGDAREAVLFIHGNPGSGDDFRALAEQIAPFCRVLAPDMPGFGQADKPEGFNYTVDGYADHIEALLEACGVDRVHLALHDFGGGWGLTWATRSAWPV